MPRHIEFRIKGPLVIKTKHLRMSKTYSKTDFKKETVVTNDPFTYVAFFYKTKPKALKFKDVNNKKKYSNANQYRYDFYWEQAEKFYKVAKMSPIEIAPVPAYYSMLNAAKSYIAYTKDLDEFVNQFGNHGLKEAEDVGESLETISVKRKENGVFPMFAACLDNDFKAVWKRDDSLSLKDLLYNLPFVHRSFVTTYSGRRKVEELFLPLVEGEAPMYYRGNDGKAYLLVTLNNSLKVSNSSNLRKKDYDTISDVFIADELTLRSKDGAKCGKESISADFKKFAEKIRKSFVYIKSDKRLWYVKKTGLKDKSVVNLNTMTINMAAMHRVSEIARYKPEQLRRLLNSKEEWLLHEYINLALDQYIDEIAAQITHQDIMAVGSKNE